MIASHRENPAARESLSPAPLGKAAEARSDEHREQEGRIAILVNGSLKVDGSRHQLSDFDTLLRGIALSDSPVLIEGGLPKDRLAVAARLHTLGRRADLPLRECPSVEDAAPLLRTLVSGESSLTTIGSWAIHEVGAWSEDAQATLARLLSIYDEGRLASIVGHERIPRIIVLTSDDSKAKLSVSLARRLSYFRIALCLTGTKEKAHG